MDWQTILIVIGVVVGVALVAFLLIPFLIKKGLKPETVSGIADILKGALGVISDLTPYDRICDVASTAVEYAERLYKTGEVARDERKQVAIDYIYDALEECGVEVTDQRKKIIECAIEAAVNLLPKTGADEIEASKKSLNE